MIDPKILEEAQRAIENAPKIEEEARKLITQLPDKGKRKAFENLLNKGKTGSITVKQGVEELTKIIKNAS